MMKFLEENKDDVHQQAIILILHSHGKIKELAEFCYSTKDYKTLIMFYLNRNKYEESLELLYSI